MPRRMVQPRVNEVSGVDHPAHLVEGWLLMKDASPETAELLARAEAIAKGLDPDSIKGNQMPVEITDEDREGLPENVQKYLANLEERVEKAETPTEVDSETEAFEKALAEMPEPVRKAVIENQRKTAEAERVAKALWDERQDSKFEAIAKSLGSLPDVKPEFGPEVLRKVAESLPDEYAKIEKVLRAADGIVKQSALFDEIGSNAAAPGSAQESIEGFAKSLREADKNLSEAESVALAAEQHPELYSQHRVEYINSQRGL